MRRTPITIRRRHDPKLGTRYGSLHRLVVVGVGGSSSGDDDDEKDDDIGSRESKETNWKNAMKKGTRNSCSC